MKHSIHSRTKFKIHFGNLSCDSRVGKLPEVKPGLCKTDYQGTYYL